MNILITGANRGIGAALDSAYSARGDTVLGTARGHPEYLDLDVTDPAAQAALAEKIEDTALDVVICNAGVYLDKGHSLADGYGAALWADTFAVNVTGVFLTVQNLLPHLQGAATPRIAIISSQMGSSEIASGSSYIYRASKAAALNLGRNLAVDLKGLGIAVGIYHPGWVRTDMGGGGAAVAPKDAAEGLIARIDALSLESTGAFETWDGRAHPF